ncbi:hypothetical protein BDW66DRAFT_143136 [Aspergillus desertorum]
MITSASVSVTSDLIPTGPPGPPESTLKELELENGDAFGSCLAGACHDQGNSWPLTVQWAANKVAEI